MKSFHSENYLSNSPQVLISWLTVVMFYGLSLTQICHSAFFLWPHSYKIIKSASLFIIPTDSLWHRAGEQIWFTAPAVRDDHSRHRVRSMYETFDESQPSHVPEKKKNPDIWICYYFTAELRSAAWFHAETVADHSSNSKSDYTHCTRQKRQKASEIPWWKWYRYSTELF